MVLEVAGELTDFKKAVLKVPGLEFLVEEAEDTLEPDDEFAAVDREGGRHGYSRQLFLVASDATAWQQLLSLWELFKDGGEFPRGLTPLRHLFSRLLEIRPWDDRDRLERTGALVVWERELVDAGDELVEFEIELWMRQSPARRAEAIAELRADLESEEVGGELVHQAVYADISYHGVLGRAPASLLLDAVARHELRWLRTGAIRFFQASGQLAAVAADDFQTEPVSAPGPAPGPLAGPPKVALLDGLPLGRHAMLAGHLTIDDPDGWEATTPAARRVHGTCMASVVLRGDLNSALDPLRRPLYVRPILSTQAPSWVTDAREELPRDRLAVDVVHEAVVRLFETAAVAPDVRVVVLAVGDAAQQFDRFVSPLARLLDWLAFRYAVLFLVSAGNHPDGLSIPTEAAATDDPQELQHEVLCSLRSSGALRRLLSPAESINALTIGAAHDDDAATRDNDDRIEPITSPDLPNVESASGSGLRRAVKPDILLPGGRQLVRVEPGEQDGRSPITVAPTTRPPGVRTAAPGRQAGALNETIYATGTSLATAHGGRHAANLLEELAAFRALHGDARAGPEFDAVLVKAAMVHSARWGTAATFLHEVQQESGGQRDRDTVARMVGYGKADPARALVSDSHRVTALAAASIEEGSAHTYRFPLPLSLASRTTRRRLTITLAWLTPINPEHRAYRRAALALEPAGFSDFLGDRSDVGAYSARRGTLQHDVLEGRRAVPFASESSVELVVSCRVDAGTLGEPVPYAVFVTLEVPQGVDVQIYDEVRQALHVPVPVRARPRS